MLDEGGAVNHDVGAPDLGSGLRIEIAPVLLGTDSADLLVLDDDRDMANPGCPSAASRPAAAPTRSQDRRFPQLPFGGRGRPKSETGTARSSVPISLSNWVLMGRARQPPLEFAPHHFQLRPVCYDGYKG
jgi:hypothetical protein